MLISNAKKVEGNWDFNMACTEAEVNFLMNYAVIDLIQMGAIAVLEQEEEQDVPLTNEGNMSLN